MDKIMCYRTPANIHCALSQVNLFLFPSLYLCNLPENSSHFMNFEHMQVYHGEMSIHPAVWRL